MPTNTTSGDEPTITTSSAMPTNTTNNSVKKRAKLVYQKVSIDEERISDHQTSWEQFPDNQTQDQALYGEESHYLSLDHQTSHDLQPSDIRSPSFVSLDTNTEHVTKQRKTIVLEKPVIQEPETSEEAEAVVDKSKTPLEEIKEDHLSDHPKEETDAASEVLYEEADVDKSKTSLGEIKEDDPSGHAKEETDKVPEVLQVSSTTGQQRSLSVPSYPPQLKSILRRSNAPKSLSLDIHNIDEVQDSSKQPPLHHKMSVSCTILCGKLLEHDI